MKPKQLKQAVGLLCIVCAACFGVVIPLLVSDLVDGTASLIASIDNKILLVMVFVLQAALNTAGTFQFVDIAEDHAYDLRHNIVHKILHGSIQDLDSFSLGKTPSHISNNISVIQNYLAKGVPNFIASLITIVLSLIFLFRLDYKLALVLLALLPVLALIIIPISAVAAKFSNAYQQESAQYIEKLINIFSAIPYIKSLNAEDEIEDRLVKNNQRIKKYSAHNRKVDSVMQPFLMLVIIAIVAVIFIYGGSRVTSGDMTVGTLVAFLLYIFQLLTPVSTLSSFFADMQRAKTNQEELDAYLALEPEQHAKILQLPKVSAIKMQDLQFSYNTTPLLKDIDLELNQGEKIALVGASGAGKSTLFKLLLGFYTDYQGSLCINGVDIRDYNTKSLRSRIALIPQENSIIGSDLYDFLCLGDTQFNVEEAQHMLDELGLADKFDLTNVRSNPQDFGMGGKLLSTGEKQRLSVAKALLSKRDVLLMDESTASVDSELEHTIFRMVEHYAHDKIVISIAHRLSTVKYVDRVIFFEDGRITGNDTHEHLYQTHARYKLYIDLQNITSQDTTSEDATSEKTNVETLQ